MKAILPVPVILLGLLTSQAQPLFVDFNDQGSPNHPSYQAYRATTTQPATFTSQSYSAFGTTVSVTPVWDTPTANNSIRMINRGTGNTGNVGDAAPLLQDWLGTDNRTSAIASGSNPMTLSISNLPAGTYRWLSYHHDPNDQTGIFDAYVIDANGTSGPVAVDISNGNIALADVTRWITTVVSDGVNPVRLRFVGPSTVSITAQSFFLMNGFELSFLGTESEWINTGGGNWSDAANWSANGVPNSTTSLALFGNSILAPSTVTVNIPVTLSGLTIRGANSYTVAGPNALTLAGTGSVAVESGSHTIAAPIAVSGGGGLSIIGSGTLTLSGANTYTGPTVANILTLNVSTLANGGSPSSVGASSSDAANLNFSGTLRYIGSGHTSDRLFTLQSGTRTLDASGTGALNLSNPGPLTVAGTGARTLVLTGTNAGNNTLSAVISDAGFTPNTTAITKNGPGKWILAGANTSSGNVTVNEGTLAVALGGSLGVPSLITVQSNAVLDASASGGLLLTFGQTLQGSGTVVGNVTDGSSVINPGGSNTMGTLTFANSLIMAAGGTIRMDLSAATTIGGGINDLIVVGGDLDLSSVNLLVNFTGTSMGANYRLINYSGALLGAPNVTVQGLDNTRYTATVSTATPGQVNLVISGAAASLTWFGDGGANFWDLKSSFNWTNPAISGLDQFNELDNVRFNNLGSGPNIDLMGVLRPGTVTVEGSANYSFGGAGQLSGPMTLTKAGTGTLTISNANSYTGVTTVSGGILRLANNAALGTSAGGTVIASGATLDVFGFQTSADHIQVAGSGAGGIGAIINTGAEQQNAIRLLTLTGDTFVTSDFRWDVRGLGGNSSFSGIFDLGGFTFTRAGTNRIAIVDSIATNAGNIVMLEGGMSLTRSLVDGPGYIDVGTNFVWIENSTVGAIRKPMIFAGGRLQCSGGDFVLESYITNVSGLTIDAGGVIALSNAISGAGSLTKIGGSTARLEAANTYAGNTTISNGVLALGAGGTLGGGSLLTMIAGSTFDVTASGGFTLASGKSMVAAGTVQGNLTIASGASLQIGDTLATETLAVNGSAVLGGSTTMQINGATKTRDVLSATSAITYGGTLTVNNLGGSFAAGDTFQLFSAPVRNGSFSTVNLPPLGPSQIWVNQLSANGSIVVGELELEVSHIPGGFLQFSWDPVLNGLVKLQAQTNSLSVGISNNWADYPGGTFNGTVHVPDPNNPTVFFRLIALP